MHEAPGADPLSILHVVAPAETGGLETVLLLLASGQREHGHRVRVAPTLPRPDASQDWCRALRDAGVDVEPLVLPGRRYFSELRRITHICRRWRPAIVHSHGYRSDVIGAFAARRARVPTVTTVHGFIGGDWKNRLYERVQRRAFRRFDAVVAVSQPMANELQAFGVEPRRLHIIRNAFAATASPLPRAAARAALGIPPHAFRAGWIGRLSREKGVDIAVEALEAIQDDAVTLSVIGEGPERGPAESLARRLGVDSRITWHGAVVGAARLLPALDVLVLSSRTEGTPMVLFEAMAAGVPIIATAVGGVPDVVSETEATLIPPESPQHIAEAIRATSMAPAAAAARAAAARERLVREFAVEPWLLSYTEVYRAAMAGHARENR